MLGDSVKALVRPVMPEEAQGRAMTPTGRRTADTSAHGAPFAAAWAR